METRTFAYRLPTGEELHETRRHDQDDPLYAVVATMDGKTWSLFRMTQSDDEVLRCIKELFASGQSAYVTEPRLVEE